MGGMADLAVFLNDLWNNDTWHVAFVSLHVWRRGNRSSRAIRDEVLFNTDTTNKRCIQLLYISQIEWILL